METDEIIIPEDFTIRIRIKRADQEDLIIEENGIQLKFDLTCVFRNAPPNDARWGYAASYLTQRWADKLEGRTISNDAALGIWSKCNTKSEALKKSSDSTEKC